MKRISDLMILIDAIAFHPLDCASGVLIQGEHDIAGDSVPEEIDLSGRRMLVNATAMTGDATHGRWTRCSNACLRTDE
jgi:hypothetical protein